MTSYLDSANNLRLVVAKARDSPDDRTFKYLVRSARKAYESVRKLWLNLVIKTREGVPAAESK